MMMGKKPKLVRITTVPLSLDKLLEGQLDFMRAHFEIIAVSADRSYLKKIAQRERVAYKMIPLTRKITPLKDLVALWKMYRFLSKERPEIVHSHTPKAGIIGMLAARLAGVPHRLHTVAGLPLMEARGFKRKILNAVEKWTYSCATKVYPNSFGLKDIIIKEGFCKEDKLKVIGAGSSNGIDTSYFDPEHFSLTDQHDLRKSMLIPEDEFLFVFVGRLVKDKGVNELVQAFDMLAKTQPHIGLVLVGPEEPELDPLSPETTAIIASHQHIYTTGYQQDVRPYLAFAKALVFPSYREGFPNVVLQAGAMGLPAIVSDINGCNEIITHQHNGLIIAVKDTVAIYKAMQKLLQDQKSYAHMQTKARDHITSSYQRKVIWNKILAEYRTLIGFV
ncbi:MAG: glycosyltransferase family 4 protein [Dokdonia sp.]|jgi:glycosyltransferase involved in cell wall biosynthesis